MRVCAAGGLCLAILCSSAGLAQGADYAFIQSGVVPAQQAAADLQTAELTGAVAAYDTWVYVAEPQGDACTGAKITVYDVSGEVPRLAQTVVHFPDTRITAMHVADINGRVVMVTGAARHLVYP
jgi:hypothetical protein